MLNNIESRQKYKKGQVWEGTLFKAPVRRVIMDRDGFYIKYKEARKYVSLFSEVREQTMNEFQGWLKRSGAVLIGTRSVVNNKMSINRSSH